MKQILTIALISMLIAVTGCNNNHKLMPAYTYQINEDEQPDSENSTSTPVDEKIIGSYVGDFGDNKITLLITNVTDDSVEGRSIVGGNDRPFTGTLQYSSGVYSVKAQEPGIDQYDGTFEFNIAETDIDILEGVWTPKKQTANIGSKAYSLRRRQFVYSPEVGDYPQASQRLLTSEDVENISKNGLEMMRNEIFARHGYCFKKKYLRQEFEYRDWYIPNTTNIKKDLTEIERKNIALIKKYEKYAVDFGDDFGR